MSIEIVFGHVHAAAKEMLGAAARADVAASLRCVNRSFVSFVYELGRDAGLDVKLLYPRCAAAVCNYAAAQLADDIADGDCGYLADPIRFGPGVQWILQHLYVLMLARSAVSAADLLTASREMIQTGDGQQEEVRTLRWTLESARLAAARLNGCQYAGYFHLLTAGTSHQEGAREQGANFGFALHVVGDRTHADRRWADLAAPEQGKLTALACEAVARSKGRGLPVVDRHLRYFEMVLR